MHCMKHMNGRLLAFFMIVLIGFVQAQPTVSFTFDDGITTDMPGYPFHTWNKMILNHLERAELKAIFFVAGKNKSDDEGKFLLKTWADNGHRLANHTYSHQNYHDPNITCEAFQNDFLRCDSIIKRYDTYIRLFRFPYLKEGDTGDKIHCFRNFLAQQNYSDGYVTIDASDWYVDRRLRNQLTGNGDADIDGFRRYYLRHLYERALYYEELAYQLTGRHINHILPAAS